MKGGKNNEPGVCFLAGLSLRYLCDSYFFTRIASFAAFAMRNFTTVFAGI